jgi:hypothetical protein
VTSGQSTDLCRSLLKSAKFDKRKPPLSIATP